LEPPIAPGYNGESTWLLRLHPGTGGGKNRNLPRGECLALGLDVNWQSISILDTGVQQTSLRILAIFKY